MSAPEVVHGDAAPLVPSASAPSPWAQLDAVYAAVPVGLAVVDRDLRFVRVNDRLARVAGFPPEDHVGRSVEEVLPALAPRVLPFLKQVLATGRPLLELELDGPSDAPGFTVQAWRLHLTPIPDEGGVAGVNVVVVDVGRRRTLDARRSFVSELGLELSAIRDPRALVKTAVRRLAAFLGTDRVAVLDVDADEGSLGWRSDQAFGPPPSVVTVPLRSIGAMLDELRQGRTVAVADAASDARVGWRPAEARAFVHVPFGSGLGLVAVLTASSSSPRRWTEDELHLLEQVGRLLWPRIERARADEQLLRSAARTRRALDQLANVYATAPVGLCFLDRDLRFVNVNAVLAAMHGVPAVAHLGRRLREVRPALAELVEPLLRRVLDTGEPLVDLELREPDPVRGTERCVTASWYPIRDDDGAIVGLNAVLQDCSLRKRTELALQQALWRADHANRAKSEFLANMSHEIRTPMSAMLGYAGLLRRRVTDPATASLVEVIERNGRHLLELLEDILDLSSIEAGRPEIARTAFDPAEVVDEVVALMRPRAEAAGVALTAEPLGPMPARITSDRRRFKQILVNLVGNAVKFTDVGTVRVVVRRSPDQPTRLVVDVIDTGIGIHPDDRVTLFEPFARGSRMDRRRPGTGLGLAITKRIVELLGGTIEVESQVGEGSRFSFDLDVAPVEEASSGPADVAVDAVELRPPDLQARILAADDQPDLLELLRATLTDAGADVVVASDGREAVERAEAARAEGRPFDLVLMDMQMPVLDGWRATELLRARGFGGPILALTAAAMPEDRARSIAAGCDLCLIKPVVPDDLVRTVADQLALVR